MQAVDARQAACIAAVEAAGFRASAPVPALRQRRQNEESVAAQGRRVVAFGLASCVFILSMFVGDLGTVGRLDLRLAVAMLAALPVYVYFRRYVYHRRAWAALRRGTANMDVLVHLGTTVAMAWSTLVVLAPYLTFLPRFVGEAQHVFFDGAAFIVAFVLLGNYLEAKAKLKATDAVHGLMRLQPNEAWVVVGERTEAKAVDTITSEVPPEGSSGRNGSSGRECGRRP